MTDAQVADIKAAQEKMMESAQKLFAKMYEQTQQAGGQAGPDMNMGGRCMPRVETKPDTTMML